MLPVRYNLVITTKPVRNFFPIPSPLLSQPLWCPSRLRSSSFVSAKQWQTTVVTNERLGHRNYTVHWFVAFRWHASCLMSRSLHDERKFASFRKWVLSLSKRHITPHSFEQVGLRPGVSANGNGPGSLCWGGWLTHVARNCDSSFAGRMRVGMLVRGGGSSPTFCALRKQLPIVLKTRCFYFERQLQFCSFLGNNSLRTEGCACATATGWFCRVAGVGGGANVSLVIFHVQIENVQVWTIWLKVLHFFVRGDQNYGPGHRCRSRQNFGDA